MLDAGNLTPLMHPPRLPLESLFQHTRDRFKAQVVPHSSVQFRRKAYLLRSYIPCSPQSAGEFGFVFRPVILRVGGDLCPNEMSRVTPIVEQNTLFERLASGRNYDDVMLGTGVGTRLGPVEL